MDVGGGKVNVYIDYRKLYITKRLHGPADTKKKWNEALYDWYNIISSLTIFDRSNYNKK